MKLELTKRDLKLIKLALCVLIVFLMARFLILPGIGQYRAHLEENRRLDEEKKKIERAIDEISLLEQAIPKHLQELERVSEPYYARMENRQVDEVLTGLAVQCGLFPVSLSITEAAPMIPQPYLESGAEDGAKDEGADGAEDEAENEVEDGGADGAEDGVENDVEDGTEHGVEDGAEDGTEHGAEDGAEGADGQTSYLLAGEATFLLRGSEAQVLQFLDQIEKNYPSIQIRAMHRGQRAYLNEALDVIEQPDVSLTMAIYMCDWDAVTEREQR